MPDVQLNIRHAFTSRVPTGGTKSETVGTSSLKRAPTEHRPKVATQHRYAGDHVLTRTGHRGALLLGRLLKSHTTAGTRVPSGPTSSGTGGTTSVSGGKVDDTVRSPSTNTSPPPPTFDERVSGFERSLRTLSGTARELARKGGEPLPTDTGERSRAETEFVGAQTKLKGDAGKLQGEVSKLLAAKRKELEAARGAPQPDRAGILRLEAETDRLTGIRRTLVEIQIAVDLPGPGALALRPIGRESTMMALWDLHGPGDTSNEPLLTRGEIEELGRMVEAFDAGADHATMDDGTRLDRHEFGRYLELFAGFVERAGDRDLGEHAARELRALRDEMLIRASTHDAVVAFETILDRIPDFPVGGALRSIASALPGMREDATSSRPDRLGRAAEGLATLAGMIRDGETFEGLAGHDPAFDKACLILETERGGRLSVDKLRSDFEAAGRTFPSEELRALAHKPDHELTVRERARLLDLVGTGRLATLAEARAICAEVDSAREAGRTAARLRHELTAVNRRLADVLTVDRRRWFKPWTWGDGGVRVFTTTASSVRKDAQLMKALKSFGNDVSGRDVAVLMAHLSRLEFETLKAEKNALGLHPGLVVTALEPDPDNPLAHVGITNEDLAGIGVTVSDLSEVAETVDRLHRQGVGSVDDVHEVTRALDDVSRIVLKSRQTRDMIRGFEGESARAMGQHLLDIMVTDADASYRRAHLMPVNGRVTGDRSGLTVDSETVRGHFRDVIGRIGRDIRDGDPGAWTELGEQGRQYRDHEATIVDIYAEHRAVSEEIEARRTVITSGNETDALGIDVSAGDPRGLRSAKTVLEALRAHDEFMAATEPKEKAAARNRRDAALDRLRGYDTEAMRRPWHAKVRAFFGGGERPDIARLEELRRVAEAIVYIREDAPKLHGDLENQIEAYGEALDTIAAERRAAHPKEIARVTGMIRAAVLTEWTNAAHAKSDFAVRGGAVGEGFDPGVPPARTNIEKRLKDWGLDLDVFAPELDDALFSRMSPVDMQQWASETSLSSETREELRARNPALFSKAGMVDLAKAIRHEFTVDGLLDRRAMDESTKTSLLSMLEAFQEGDKLDLRAGQRITVDSGKIPVEPTGILGIRARLAGAHLGQFEIERGGDGFKLHLRRGLEGKGNLDLVAGKKFDMGGGGELSIEGSLGVEGSGSRLKGVTLSFANTREGAKALVDLVAKMVDGEPIDLWDWRDATDVGDTIETRTRIGAGVGVVGRAQIGGKGPELSGTKDTLGAGLSLSGTAGVARGTKDVTSESLSERTRKGEVEYSVTVGASLSVYARLYNPLNMGTGALARTSGGQDGATDRFGVNDQGKTNYNITDNVQNTEIAGLGASVTANWVSKWKQVTDRDGFFTKCEKVRQANVRQGVVQAFAAVDTPEMRRLLESPGNEAFETDFRTFMGLMTSRDLIAVTYAIRPEVQVTANELVARANAARRQGDEEGARRFEKQARALVNDDANYVPSKIGLISTNVRKSELTQVNARWLRWDTFSDGKSEHTGVTLAVPPPT